MRVEFFKQQNLGVHFNDIANILIESMDRNLISFQSETNEGFEYLNRDAYDINLAEFVLLYNYKVMHSDIREDIILISNLAEVFSYFTSCYIECWNGYLQDIREEVFTTLFNNFEIELKNN